MIKQKNVFELLSEKWKIKDKSFLLEIINYLEKGVKKEYSFRDGFEFSLVEKKPSLRLVHLYFWQPKLSPQIVQEIIKEREKNITYIFQKISQQFNSSYNLSLLQSFFKFNRNTGLWPIQFGLEYQKESSLKIKIYLSLEEKYSERKAIFSLKNFSDYFNLNFLNLNKLFNNKNFDTVAIDFLPANKYLFKFYPYSQKNRGYLYRILPFSTVESVKIWQRFPEGLLFEEIPKKFCFSSALKKIIEKNKFKIHYLCQEKNKRSIYFR